MEDKFISFDQTKCYFQDNFEIALMEGKTEDSKFVNEWIDKNSGDGVNFLAWYGKWFNPITKWESTSNEDRDKHSKKVARLARELAAAMEEDAAPKYPFALALFETNSLRQISMKLGGYDIENLIDIKGLELNDTIRLTAYYDVMMRAASYMSGGPEEPQDLPSLLRHLANYAEFAKHERKRDARPNTTNPNARVFARELSGFFECNFNIIPDMVIAACVRIKFPEIDPPPGHETIRDWRGSK